MLTRLGENGYGIPQDRAVEAIRNFSLAVPILPEPPSAGSSAIARETRAAVLTDDRGLAAYAGVTVFRTGGD